MASKGVIASVLMVVSYFIPYMMIFTSLYLIGLGPFGGPVVLLIFADILTWSGGFARSATVFLVGVILFIIAHILLWRTFKSLKEETGIEAFGIASLFMLLGAIFFVLGIGIILAIIGWIFSAVGFGKLEEKNKTVSPQPTL